MNAVAKWRVRSAEADDAVALAACIDAAYAGYRARINDLPQVSEGIADEIATNLVWVAELDRRIVGGLILVPRHDHAVLANLAVHPDASGMGIGRALIEHAEGMCRTLKKAELRLSTHVAMPENVDLYQHLGWEETGRSGNKVQMTKHL